MALRKLGIAFKLHTYVYDSAAESIGLQAAEALGVEPGRMLKTLMAEVDGNAVCAVVPSDREVSMGWRRASRSGSSTCERRSTAGNALSRLSRPQHCRKEETPRYVATSHIRVGLIAAVAR